MARLPAELIATVLCLAACSPYELSQRGVSDYWVGSKPSRVFNASRNDAFPYTGPWVESFPEVCWMSDSGEARCSSLSYLDPDPSVWKLDEGVRKLIRTSFGPVWIGVDGLLDYELQCPDPAIPELACDSVAADGLSRLSSVSAPQDVVSSTYQVCVLGPDGVPACHAGFTPELDFQATAIRGSTTGFWVCALGDAGQRACWDRAGDVDISSFPELVDVDAAVPACVLEPTGELLCAKWRSQYYWPDSPLSLDVAVASGVVAFQSGEHRTVYETRTVIRTILHYQTGRDGAGPCVRRDSPVPDGLRCDIREVPGWPTKYTPPCLLDDEGRLVCDLDPRVLYGAKVE